MVLSLVSQFISVHLNVHSFDSDDDSSNTDDNDHKDDNDNDINDDTDDHYTFFKRNLANALF